MATKKYSIGVDFGTQSGRAMFGAVVAGKELGGYDSIIEAAANMKRLKELKQSVSC